MSTPKPAPNEFQDRIARLRERLDHHSPAWQAAVVTRKMSIYYLTGAIVSGALWIPRDGKETLFARRGFGQARVDASCKVQLIRGFRDMAETIGPTPDRLWMEKDGLTLSTFQRFCQYFNVHDVESIDGHLMAIRAIKSLYEIECLRQAGAIHAEVLEEVAPTLLTEGISEAQLATQLLTEMLNRGAQGMIRLNMFENNMLFGYVCFGTSSLMSNDFDGPGGVCGLGTTVRCMGSRDRKLARGDLVFIDCPCTIEGYHTDKTAIYLFGKPSDPTQEKRIRTAHEKCTSIQLELANRMKPGVSPSELYESTMEGLDERFRKTFLGYADQQVRFLGHSVGLMIDEPPAIARGFDEPLAENMVFALEPKYAIENVGMVGTENTYLITADGGERLTGDQLELIEVK